VTEKLKVLVVDDEPFNVDYLVQELEEYDVDTLTAEDGVQALKQIADHSPDLVLLDIMMPQKDGFQVLTEMKADAEFRDIPVIIISAHSDMENILKGIELGAEDYLPKPFDPPLLEARVNASLDKKRFRNLEKKYFASIQRELKIGKKIQADFLPEQIPSVGGWQIEVFFQGAKEVSGDFYDVFELPNGKLVVAVGDVTDKGVGSALYMALYRSLIRAFLLDATLNEDTSIEKRLLHAINQTNAYICNQHEEPRFLTLFIGILDPSSGKLDYVSAGHDHPFLLGAKKALQEIKPTGPIIGMLEEAEFKVQQLSINADNLLFIYTDGAIDAMNVQEERFGTERLKELAAIDSNPETLVEKIKQTYKDYSGLAEQFDDLTFLVIKRD
jgi:serine phosphatase RsbU (regulator of sigma subunit)